MTVKFIGAILLTQIVMGCFGLVLAPGQQPSSLCAVSLQYPLVLGIYVHLVSLICAASDPSLCKSTALVVIVLGIVGVALPLPTLFYTYVYGCNATSLLWFSEAFLNVFLVVVWWRRTSPTEVSVSVSISDNEA